MQMLLKDKELWSIAVGLEVKPTRDFAKWEKRNKKVRTSLSWGYIILCFRM